MIPNFKTYMNESVWGDMRRKSLGQEKRIEDDIDLMDPITFCDYIKHTYKLVSTQGLEIFVFGNTEINVPIFEYDLGTRSTDIIYYDSENKRVFSHDTFVYHDDKLLEKLEKTYKVKNFKIGLEDYMSISPKDGSESTNTFFLEVIDYLLENANVFYHRILIPNDDVNESVWGSIRKKSLGQEIRNENIVDFDSLDGGTMDDLYNYIIQNYEYVQKPASEYKSIRQLSNKNISIPITLDGGMMETIIDYSSPDEMEFIIIRNDLVKYLDDEAYSRYFDYVEKDNPTDENTKIIVDGDYFPKKNMIGIIDALLENVPNPALRKKRINESVWGDVRKKSLGQEVREEDNVNNMDDEELVNYLNNKYSFTKGYNFQRIGNNINFTYGYMKHEDVNPDYWKSENTRNFWGRDTKCYYIFVFYDSKEHSVTMAKIGKGMLTMQKSTAKIFDELDKKFDIYEDNNCVWFRPLNGGQITASFFIEVIDGLIDAIQPPLIQTIFKK